MGVRKALIVGIDNYAKQKNLHGCVNDANSINNLLMKNYDESRNFDVKTLINNKATAIDILRNVNMVFDNDSNIEIGLFYFAGHGCGNENGGAIVCFDGEVISFQEIMKIVNDSKCNSKIVILDCCFSGKMASDEAIGNKSILSDNTVVLTACSGKQTASEKNKRGVFSLLLQSGLEGGAANILGEITPGGLYAYIDKALGAWEQRPFFKANVSSFVSLRYCEKRLSAKEIHKGMKLFKNKNSVFKLDPSFEFTNNSLEPLAKQENIAKFKILQKLCKNGLVDPVGEEHMYYAAMHFKSCKLTKLGRHYWQLCKERRI